MSRIIYVNGAYKPYEQATLHVEDRATLFADSVYEVIEVKAGKLVDEAAHIERLTRSLKEIEIKPDFSLHTLPFIISQVVRRNHVKNGYVYLQVSRGSGKRDFIFPDPKLTPATLVIYARSKNPVTFGEKTSNGLKVITLPDIRWGRPDIKTTALIASVLARQSAKQKNANEAWLYDENNMITEGAASNAWIINDKAELITRPVDGAILKGITRQGVMRAAKEVNLTYVERTFSVTEAKAAKEAFISAATALVSPVIKIDNETIGNGKPGPITLKLRSIFHDFAQLTE